MEEKSKEEAAWEAPEIQTKMTKVEAGSKGEAMLELIADLYTLIDWEEGGVETYNEPFVNVRFYKDGRFTLETYRDGGMPTEFFIDEDGKLN